MTGVNLLEEATVQMQSLIDEDGIRTPDEQEWLELQKRGLARVKQLADVVYFGELLTSAQLEREPLRVIEGGKQKRQPLEG